MPEQIIIDGNNLWHAVRTHGPVHPPGRETLVKILDRWAGQANTEVLIVFDGPAPREGLAKQMATRRVNVRFSAPQSADDVIERLLTGIRKPSDVRVVTSDAAVRNDAIHRHCRHTDSVQFVSELFPSPDRRSRMGPAASSPAKKGPPEKLAPLPNQDTDEWLRWLQAEQLDVPDEWKDLAS